MFIGDSHKHHLQLFPPPPSFKYQQKNSLFWTTTKGLFHINTKIEIYGGNKSVVWLYIYFLHLFVFDIHPILSVFPPTHHTHTPYHIQDHHPIMTRIFRVIDLYITITTKTTITTITIASTHFHPPKNTKKKNNNRLTITIHYLLL